MRKPWMVGAVVAAAAAALLVAALSLASGGDDNDAAKVASPSPAATATSPAATATPTVPATQPTVPPTAVAPQPSATVSPPVVIAPAPTPTAPAGTRIVPAPIETLTVLVRESFPPQYGLSVKAGLPGGCARRHGATVARNGTAYAVEVTNTLPTANVPCTLIYGTYEINLSLPGPFVPGTTYTVTVNDKQTTFTTQ
ncbi:MAG TPA: hypothetical protein VJB57_00605 [Dehalococcoidia bacterium]|nr:hypothetical protein [Dehalococcoidia bacterium]